MAALEETTVNKIEVEASSLVHYIETQLKTFNRAAQLDDEEVEARAAIEFQTMCNMLTALGVGYKFHQDGWLFDSFTLSDCDLKIEVIER